MSDLVPLSRLQEYSWYDEELASKVFADYPSWFDDNSGINRTTTTNLIGTENEFVNESEVDRGIGTGESLEECIKHVNIRTGLLLASKFMMRLVLSAPLGIFTEW